MLFRWTLQVWIQPFYGFVEASAFRFFPNSRFLKWELFAVNVRPEHPALPIILPHGTAESSEMAVSRPNLAHNSSCAWAACALSVHFSCGADGKVRGVVLKKWAVVQ